MATRPPPQAPPGLITLGPDTTTTTGILLSDTKKSLAVKAGKSTSVAIKFHPARRPIGQNFIRLDLTSSLVTLAAVPQSPLDFTA